MARRLHSDINQYTPTVKPRLVDVEAIYQSINNILSTRRFQRLFNLDAGIDFEDVLFEPVDDINSLEILRLVSEKLEELEPRIIINFSKTEIIPDEDNNAYDVDLIFTIRGQGDEEFEFEGTISK